MYLAIEISVFKEQDSFKTSQKSVVSMMYFFNYKQASKTHMVNFVSC